LETSAAPAEHPSPPDSIVAMLLHQAAVRGARTAFTVHEIGGQNSRRLSYGELLQRSLRVAAALRMLGLRQGDRVLICLPTSVELLLVLYGALLAGGVCVPLYPPVPGHGIRRWKEQALAVARVAQPCGAVVMPHARLHMAALLERVTPDAFSVTPRVLESARPDPPATILPGEDLAFIQFTSGTTRQPRGVSVTHGALMANIRALLQVMPLTDDDVSVSWLPPYHDMGLVGHIFVPLCCAAHQHLMPPATLLRDPAQWLRLITRTRATQTTAPNFAYSMCARRIDRSRRASLDLSSLRWALNGAETVLAETIDQFCERFGHYGFARQAFRPVYGLAEATLAVTFARHGGAQVDWVHRGHLASSSEARQVPREDPDAQAFVSVGHPVTGHQLRVVDAQGTPCDARRVGQVQVSGPCVMQGYFNNPQATLEVLRDGWLATQDLGYRDEDGRLHITGRQKDLIIKGGRNYLPQDLEAACLDVAGLRPGRTVAFGATNPRTGTEDIVLVAEARRGFALPSLGSRDPRHRLLLHRVDRAVHARVGIRPDHIELVAPGVLPKTTSGKLQRGRVKAAYEAGTRFRSSHSNGVVEDLRSAVDLVRTRIRRLLGWQ